MKELGMVLAGLIVGGFLGWLSGIAWFELVEVPKAASMDPAIAASYLCAEGRYLPLLAVAPGAIVGAILIAIIVARSGQAGVHGNSQDQPQ
jgi:hypothetical protein